MIKLTIDNKSVEIEEGSSLLDAANKLGIEIPTMCHLKGYSNHPSCMVCMVKDLDKGTLHPSCAFPAQNHMNISTTDTEVIEARKDALELLLSDHVGDCEAPCRVACPAFMDIPNMNRLIARGKDQEALQLVKEEIALPIVLGYVCSAPCEKACRRKPMDGALTICQLKKYVALEDAKSENPYLPEKAKNTSKKIAVVGAGIAGLSAAFHLVKLGNQITVFEKEDKAGGTLCEISTELPAEMLELEIKLLQQFGIDIKCNSIVDDSHFQRLAKEYDSLILANGLVDSDWAKQNMLELNAQGKELLVDKTTFETSIKGIFACGSVVREQKMAVQALAHGKLVAHQVHEHLNKNSIPNKRSYFNSKFGKLAESEFIVYLVEGKDNDAVSLESKLHSLSADQAKIEAERCMHCDCRKVNTCKLRDYGQQYKVDQKAYQTSERNKLKKQFTHSEIVYEAEKCIRCGLCVDIANAEKEELGLTFVGRGFDVRIGVPLNETMDRTLTKVAIKCAEACPTGALALK